MRGISPAARAAVVLLGLVAVSILLIHRGDSRFGACEHLV